MNDSNLTLGYISEMQNEHAGNFAIPSESFRDGHVQLRRHYVRKVVKAQSSLMAVDPLCDLSSIPRPERPKHQVRPFASWKARQPIDSPMLTNPVSDLNVVGMCVLSKTRRFGLFRREESLLVLCDLVEPLGGFFPLFPHSTILQLI